jgi:hypothetical protein
VNARTPINLVLFLVVALRSLLPVGFMVQAADAASGGSFEIVICTSSGTKVLALDADGAPQPSKQQHMDHGLCPFSSAGAAALAEAGPQPLVRTVAFAAVTYTLAAAQFAETPKPGAVSARGPPSLVI